MKCTAVIHAQGDPERLHTCLAAENLSFGRATCTLTKTADGIQFDVGADDAVALRASLNTISQLLGVYEKVENHEG